MSFVDQKEVIIIEEISNGSNGGSFSRTPNFEFWENKLLIFIIIIKVVSKGVFKKNLILMKKYNTSSSSTNYKNYLNELDILSELDHKNIIKLLGYCDKRKNSFMIFEYMEGGSLFELIHSENMLINCLKIVRGVVNGMIYLHSKSILHLDLTSSNVLLNKKRTKCKISDFSLSRISTPLSSEMKLVNKKNSAKGSLRWMSPEISKGLSGSTKSDVWSFGCLLMEILNQKIPFEDLDEQAVFSMLQSDESEIPFDKNYILDSSFVLGSLILKCLKKQPRDRPYFDEISKLIENCHNDDFNINLKSNKAESKLCSIKYLSEKIEELEKKIDSLSLHGQCQSTPIPFSFAMPENKLNQTSFNDESASEFYISKGTANGRQVHEGPRGGRFVYTTNGKKRYI